MEYIKIKSRNAEKARALIVRLNLFDRSRAVIHSRSYVYFPTLDIKQAKDIKLIGKIGASMVSRNGRKKEGKEDYKSALERAVGRPELLKLSRGYDQMGNIAVIEFRGKRSEEKKIAKILMRYNNSIKTVLAKAGAVTGKYRIRKLRYVAGAKNYVAQYRENGCTFRFDVRKAYFSNRLSFERSRILRLVKKGERVMVMFAGVGPFAIEIARNTKGTRVVAIELNRSAYKYMNENIKLNRLTNVKAIQGDVKKIAAKYGNFADRIIMPLPKSSLDFLDQAYKVAGRNAVVHLYAFSSAKNPFGDVIKALKEHSKRRKFSIRVLNKRVVRPYSASEREVVIDYRMKK